MFYRSRLRLVFPMVLLLLLSGCARSTAQEAPPSLPAATASVLTETQDSAEAARSPFPAPTAVVDEAVAALRLPPGYHAQTVAEGLQGPTQMIWGEDGRLWVAQLAGGENAGEGEIVAISLESGERERLLQGLDKPTGIALLDGSLWIQASNSLLRAPLQGAGLGTPEVVLADLPFNGRSLGTLTVTPDGFLLFETSGRRRGNDAIVGSGTLWKVDPSRPDVPLVLATGLKGAYAHTVDGRGRIWSTEIGDDPVDGVPPPDELNWIVEGADFGWPSCYGMQEAARGYGGSPEACAATRAPVVLFAQRATPVAIVPSPWENDTLLVALWGPGDTRVVAVEVESAGQNGQGEIRSFVEGLEHPQALLVEPGGTLLVADFGTGRIFRITREIVFFQR